MYHICLWNPYGRFDQHLHTNDNWIIKKRWFHYLMHMLAPYVMAITFWKHTSHWNGFLKQKWNAYRFKRFFLISQQPWNGRIHFCMWDMCNIHVLLKCTNHFNESTSRSLCLPIEFHLWNNGKSSIGNNDTTCGCKLDDFVDLPTKQAVTIIPLQWIKSS